MPKSMVTGIDIGKTEIKTVSISLSEKGYKLVQFQSISSLDDIVADNHVVNHQRIVKKLKELKKSLPFFKRSVALSVPDEAVISRFLYIDQNISEVDREFALYEAFSLHSAISPQELSMDFLECSEGDSMNEPKANYQVFATRKEVVESRVQAAKQSGLTPILVDTQAHSLLQVWYEMNKVRPNRQAWLLVDIGFEQSVLCIGHRTDTPYYKQIPVGVPQVMFLGAPDENQSFRQGCNELLNHLLRHIQMYRSSKNTDDIEGVCLTGESNAIYSLQKHLIERLGVDCELLNPLQLIHPNAEKILTRDDGYSYSFALGVALRGHCWREG